MNNRKFTILIVDNDQNLLSLWSTLLKPLAYIRLAATMTEGLDQVDQADILIFDWRLDWGPADPLLDRWISKQGHRPVAVVTGALDQAARYRLYARGVHNTFQKPISNDLLISLARKYLRDVEREALISHYDHEISKLKRYIIVLAGALLASTAGPEVIDILAGVFL